MQDDEKTKAQLINEMNEKTRILAVDDDPHLLQGMSRILKSAGYETIEAATGTDCLRFTIEQKPDLVLLDVMLPDINGIEVCKRIKLDKTLADIYVVLLSSLRTSSDDQAEGLETGADGYIARPVSNRELLARVKALLRLKRAEESIRKSEERFRRISSMTSDISYSCTKSNNAAYSIDWIMGAVERITGHSEDDVIALGCWRNLVFDEDLPIFDSKVIGLAPGTSASCELRLAHNTGKVVWVASLAECVLDSGSPDSLRLYGALVDITERKLAEEELRESVEKYRAVFENATVGINLLDGQARIVDVNQALSSMLGYSVEELRELTFSEITHPDDSEISRRNLEALMAGDIDSYRIEKRYIAKDGSILWVDLSTSSIRDEKGEHVGTVGVIADITDRKVAEEALLESEEIFKYFMEYSPIYVFFKDENLRSLRLSKNFETMVGKPVTELLGKSDDELFSSEFAKSTVADDMRVMKEGKGITIEEELNGRFYSTTKFPILIDGNPRYLAGYIIDITDRKQSEDALRSSEERFRTLFETSNDAIFLTDGPKFIECNPKALQIFGCQEEKDMVGHTPMEFSPEKQPDGLDSKEETLKYVKSAIESGPQTFNWQHCRKDGSPFDAVVTLNSLTLKGKAYLQGSVRDITESKLAEEAIRESEEKFSKAFFLSPDAITINRLIDGMFVSVNEGFKQLSGYVEEEFVGKTVPEINIWDNPEDRNRWIKRLKAEGIVNNFEALFRTKDGDIIYGLVSASIIVLNGVDHILAVARDITERVRSEEERESLRSQLLQAQKMEAIGTLAGGVAHDFNNLLQVALGYSEILLVGKNPDHPDYDKLHTINTTAKRGADLVQRLMVFSRKGDTKPRSLNLNHEVTQLKKLLERTIPKMITIELSLQSWLPVINAEPVQVEQILLNLAINAKDAMPESGGKLTIETRKVMLDEEYCRTHLESKPGQYVMISVSDTGHGMSQETVQHIFEPFFTTKGEGKGTGLGLAMVYGIMKHHEGFINCYSEPGHGTTFRIYFPVVSTELEEDSEQESAVLQGGSETILLVDDEESLCDIGSQLLTRAGYTVLTATSARDALDLYRNQKSDISLVILDLIMPEMGGKECFKELAKIDSKVKVILSSGFLSDGTSEEARVFGFRGLVEKPYNMRQLLGLVREVLDGD
ncbi:MAG: PAS domain S-box protein [Deltaproteobacteria bacterium]|nr:PAS domain S-box protein [Deltaproteobacteria bacterium]